MNDALSLDLVPKLLVKFYPVIEALLPSLHGGIRHVVLALEVYIFVATYEVIKVIDHQFAHFNQFSVNRQSVGLKWHLILDVDLDEARTQVFLVLDILADC